MRFAIAAVLVLAAANIAGCVPAATVASLPPTLTLADAGGVEIAVQNGIPVPTFSWQPRPRLDLDGAWLVERAVLDPALTMTDRSESLAAIETDAAGRQLADHEDADWQELEVPGTLNAPPDGREEGAWYRRHFRIPSTWAGDAVTIRFGSANYVADAWLNGTWLGYHEGAATPFAFEAGELLRAGEDNVLAVRVHTIPLGTRSDVVPWALIDWWNYGGLTGPVWLEAAPATHIVRADVVPHLDAIDVSVLVHRTDRPAGPASEDEVPIGGPPAGLVRLTIYAASVDEENLLDPDPRALVPRPRDALAVVSDEVALPSAGGSVMVPMSVLFGAADAWSPARPALYVLRAQLVAEPGTAASTDESWTTFGIRRVAVDPLQPRVLLNGEPVFFQGVGLHAETLDFDAAGELTDGSPYQAPEDIRAELDRARIVDANLVRAGHQPADPTMLMLADRLGFAVWEEIPLYHATPLVFERTMGRGIPQQMVREMALRDMNNPSVLFHGFANESTGDDPRKSALAELHDIDRAIDGTRLTGQAAYGWRPDDPTQAPLDVAGFTMYHGVFYGLEAGPDTRRALRAAHEANPTKPIMALEFGRWADFESDEERQRLIFEETYPAFEHYRADEPGGFVSGATWWTLEDFATQLPGIGLEDFGLFRPDGTLRPAGESALGAFVAPAGRGDEQMLEPDLERPRARPARVVGDWALVGYLAYAIGVSLGMIGLALFVLTRRGGRAVGRAR